MAPPRGPRAARPHPPPAPNGTASASGSRTLVVAILLTAASISFPLASSNHAVTVRLGASAASSSTWTNAAGVTDGSDANFASTSQGGAILTVTGFQAFLGHGTITKVQVWIRQQQLSHVDDRLRAEARAPGQCANVELSPNEFEATSSPTWVGLTASCDSGWTRDALAALQVTLESRSQLLLTDGAWRVMHVAIDITYSNQPPSAHAGSHQDVGESGQVTLDASLSTDPNAGEPLSYAWQQLQGPAATLTGANSARPTFQAPSLSTNQPVTLRFQVTVTDTEGHASTAAVDVTVRNVNQPPQAVAGPDQTVGRGVVVTLDGSASSDPDQDVLSYRWSQTAGPSVTLDSPNTARTTFLAPSSDTSLTFLLRVTDPSSASASASLAVRVGAGSPSPSPSPTSSPSSSPTPPPTSTPTPTPSATPTPTASASPSSSPGGPGSSSSSPPTSPSPSTPASHGPTPTVGTAHVRLDPSPTRVAAGATTQVRAVLVQADGNPATPASTHCAWDSSESGATLSPEPSDPCQARLEAGLRLGTQFVLRVTVTSANGSRLGGATPVLIAANATPQPTPNSTTDQPIPCLARFSAVQEPVPVLPETECGLALAVLRLKETGREAWFLTRILPGPPQGIPPAPSRSASTTYLEVQLTRPDGQAIALHSADLQFAIPREWDASCASPSCVPALFHYAEGAWNTLLAREVRSNETHREFAATTPSFSLFAIGGAPTTAAPPTTAPASPWVTAIPWASALGLLALVALGYIGGRRRARRHTVASRIAAEENARSAPTPVPAHGAAEAGPSDLVDELRNEELVQFLNNASHDLAGPLTPIRLQLHMLTELAGNELTDRQKKALDVVGRNVDHLGLLITDLKDASRLQAGKLKLFPEPLDLNGVAAKAAESFQAQAEQAGIQLTTRLADPAPHVGADPGRLTQVLYNFLGNALKFTPRDGHVRVETEAAGQHAILRVRDTGRGLSAEDIQRLFRPFSQVHGKEEKKKGTGLGLYICKGIAEAHGGRVGCTSSGPGRGSTFFIQLPLAPRTPEAPNEPQPVRRHAPEASRAPSA